MKIKLNRKKQVNEELVTGIILFALLVNTFVQIYNALAPLIKQASGKLKSGIKNTEDVIESLETLSEEEKQNYFEQLEKKQREIEELLRQIQEDLKTNKRAAMEQRPSAQVAAKIAEFNQTIKDVEEKASDELEKDAEKKEKLNKAKADIASCVGTLESLDFIAAISSKKDPKGLFQQIGSLSVFEDDAAWLEFVDQIAKKVPEDQRRIKQSA